MSRSTNHSRWLGGLRTALPALLLALPIGAPLSAQGNASAGWDPQAILREESFVMPPATLERIIKAPRVDISFNNPSSDRSWFLRTTGPERGDIADYGKPHLWIGGVQVDSQANRARSLTISNTTGLLLINPRNGDTRTIAAPKGAESLSAAVWSPDGTRIAYIANFVDASHAFVADVSNGRSTQVSRTPLLATMVTDLTWTADSRQLIAVLIPTGRGAVPVLGNNGIADGPQVRLTESRAVPQPVHFSLLEGPHDKAMLDYYTVGQLALLDVRSRAERRIGTPQLFSSVSASVDGEQLRVTRVLRPYSYLVPVSRFGTVDEVWDLNGRLLVALDSSPLREENPRTGGAGAGTAAATDTSRRNVAWNPIAPGLVYFQNIVTSGATGGRGSAGVRYVSWRAPYGVNDTTTLFSGSRQFNAVSYSSDGQTMFASDSGAVIVSRVDDTTTRFRLPEGVTLASRGRGFGGGGGGGARGADTTNNGRLTTTTGALGDTRVVLGSDNRTVYVEGTRTPGPQWQERPPQPWVDRLDIESGARSRVFESNISGFDELVTPLDDDFSQFIYTHESRTTVPDAYLRTVATNESRKLTQNVDVAPEVTKAVFKRFQVKRPRDGAKFWVEVTLPADWKPGTKVPGVIWFYPREYSSVEDYDRSRFSTNIQEFPTVPAARPATATSLWVAGGYAFIEPDIPIFGDAGRMNDNFTQDLAENLNAVLDAVVDSGFVDREHIGLGGHSYGAFSTVNAMTLVPYFKAGIAGDGMYNRSLTPFGFQSERRNFYEAQDMYLDVSPFFRADKLAGALLMYHSTEDQNVGTAPMSSVRMYQALNGLGKNAALYMYPYEDHSVGAYESDLDMWARWLAWFDVYVKNPAPASKVNADVVP